MNTTATLPQKLLRAGIAFAGVQQQKRYIITVASLICLSGWFAASMLPNKYESSATVLADTRSMLKPLLSGIAVQNDTEQAIQVIAQTLLSRDNLEKIALKADLDVDAGTTERYERLIAKLKNDIQIGGSSKSNVYTISYSHGDPEIAKKVVELTLKQFLDTVMRQSKLDSNSATDFLVTQIAERKTVLEASELALAQFKQENEGTLPNQGGTYYAALSTLRTQLEDLDGNIASKQTELDTLRATFLPPERSDGTPVVHTAFDERLRLLQQALDAERLNYTDNHPRVKELLLQIKGLEDSRLAAQSEILAQAAKGAMPSADTGPSSDTLQAFALQVSRLESEISVLRNKKSSTETRLQELQKQVEIIPAIEAKLTSLQRDYDVSKKMYDELNRRLEQAKLSQNANDNTSEVKFQTLEPPRAPLTPSGPPRMLLYIAVFILGLSLGVAVAFLKSKLSGKVVNVAHLSMIVGESRIIGHLLHQDHERIIMRNRGRLLVFLAWLGLLSFALVALVVFELKVGHPPGVLLKAYAASLLS